MLNGNTACHRMLLHARHFSKAFSSIASLKMTILRYRNRQSRSLNLFAIISIPTLEIYKMVAVHFVMVARLLVLSVNYNMFTITTHIF